MNRGSWLLPLALVACSGGAPDARPAPAPTTAVPTTAVPTTAAPTVPSASAPATFAVSNERDDVHFRTPSDNIHCYIGAEGVGCDIHEYTWRLPSPPPEGCEGIGDWAAVPSVGATGRASIATCVSDSRGGATRVLAYGTGVRVGNVECVSEARGLTCRSIPSRHGFFVSRDSYRLF